MGAYKRLSMHVDVASAEQVLAAAAPVSLAMPIANEAGE
jgi:hypothetical protein